MRGENEKDFYADVPNKVPLNKILCVVYFLELAKRFFGLIYHIVTPYEAKPIPPDNLNENNPKGKLNEKQFEYCKLVFLEEEKRTEILERKSTNILSLIMVIIPLLVSSIIYILMSVELDKTLRVTTIVFCTISILLIFLAFISAMRAVTVKNIHTMYSQKALIDLKKKEFVTYNEDIIGRGMLFCSTMNNALNRNIADFVKASQMLLVCSLSLLIVVAIAIIVVMPVKSDVQLISGKISVSSYEAINNTIGADLNDISTKLSFINNALINAGNLNHKGLSTIKKDLEKVQKKLNNISNAMKN